MNLIPWRNRRGQWVEPTTTLARMRQELDRMFEEPWPLAESAFERTNGWAPTLDVSENEKEVVVRAEVPGLEPSDVDVSISDHTLIISGEKREEKEDKGENYYHCERRFGSFKRMVELPDTVDPEKIDAEQSNGVITVKVAKQKAAKPKKIQVRSSGGNSSKTTPRAMAGAS